LNSLVGEAAEMAQLEAGEFELDLKPHPVNEIVRAALEQSKSTLGARRVDVRIADNLPLVRADLNRAKQVLLHLIMNAHNYSPESEPISITAEQNGDFILISVADRGRGIEEHELGLIFDKFYRGREQRYVVQGTGMGLPISKAIVEALGGTIGVISQLGHGSVFSFTLPVEKGEASRK
jgi:two-component system sensor histidine kinase KdpD